jgi:hypothetical protein
MMERELDGEVILKRINMKQASLWNECLNDSARNTPVRDEFFALWNKESLIPLIERLVSKV